MSVELGKPGFFAAPPTEIHQGGGTVGSEVYPSGRRGSVVVQNSYGEVDYSPRREKFLWRDGDILIIQNEMQIQIVPPDSDHVIIEITDGSDQFHTGPTCSLIQHGRTIEKQELAPDSEAVIHRDRISLSLVHHSPSYYEQMEAVAAIKAARKSWVFKDTDGINTTYQLPDGRFLTEGPDKNGNIRWTITDSL